MAALALEECGPQHHFRFIQLPFHLGMVEAFLADSESAKPESVLEAASRLGIAAIASATLSQGQALANMPKSVAGLLPGMTNAQRAIQFTRSTPGIAAALVGMGRREHVLENLGVAPVSPVTREQYLRLYQ
jgi:aryl-alcohol dehydrogenase-like predicted oxidoreductase